MDQNLHDRNFDDLFRKAQKESAEKAPDGMWGKIQNEMDSLKDKRHRKIIIWRRVAAAALLLLVSGALLFKSGMQSEKIPGKAEVALEEKPEAKVLKESEVSNGTKGAQVEIRKDSVAAQVPERNQEEANKAMTVHQEEQISGHLNPEKYSEENLRNHFNKVENRGVAAKVENTQAKNSELKAVPKKQESNTLAQVRKTKEEFEMENKSFGMTSLVKNALENSIDEREEVVKKLNALSARVTPMESVRIDKNKWKGETSAGKQTQPVISIRKAEAFRPYWYVTPFYSIFHADYRMVNKFQMRTDGSEEFEYSYSIGAYAGRQLTSKIGLRSGLLYSNIEVDMSPHEIYASQQPNGKIAFKYNTAFGFGIVNPDFGISPSVGDSLTTGEAEHNLKVWSVPVSVTYLMRMKKFSITPSIGLSANLISSATLETEVKDALNEERVIIKNLEGMRSFYLGLSADIAINYDINKRLSATVFPAFRYALTPVTQNIGFSTYPYSFGVGAGLTIKF